MEHLPCARHMTKFAGWNSKKGRRRHNEVACPESQAGNWQSLVWRSTLFFKTGALNHYLELPALYYLATCLSLRRDWEFQEGSVPGLPLYFWNLPPCWRYNRGSINICGRGISLGWVWGEQFSLIPKSRVKSISKQFKILNILLNQSFSVDNVLDILCNGKKAFLAS